MTRVKLRVSQIILLNNCCTREKFTFHTLNLLKKYSQKRLPWEPPRQKSPLEATFAICHNQPQLHFRLPKWVHLLLLMTLSISTSNLETTSMVVVGKIFFEERFSLFIRKLVRIISLLHKEKTQEHLFTIQTWMKTTECFGGVTSELVICFETIYYL